LMRNKKEYRKFEWLKLKQLLSMFLTVVLVHSLRLRSLHTADVTLY